MKSLKIILPIGLILCFITGITTLNLRKQSENSLKTEETITIARNRQILSEQEARRNFEKQRQQAREDREFKRSLGLMN